MRGNLEFRARKTSGTRLKGRFKVFGGLFIVAVAGVFAASLAMSPIAGATSSRAASGATTSARDGSTLAPLTASCSLQGARVAGGAVSCVAPAAPFIKGGPLPFWPHWGVPLSGKASFRPPVPVWPHWGVPLPFTTSFRPPVPVWPHWGVPLADSIAPFRPPVPVWPHWGVPLPFTTSFRPPVPFWPHWGVPLR